MLIKFHPMAKLYPFEWSQFAIYFFLCVVWGLTRALETNIGKAVFCCIQGFQFYLFFSETWFNYWFGFQVNLEYLGRVVFNMENVLYPDSVVGTDSHTTMINGLGIVGWGEKFYLTIEEEKSENVNLVGHNYR